MRTLPRRSSRPPPATRSAAQVSLPLPNPPPPPPPPPPPSSSLSLHPSDFKSSLLTDLSFLSFFPRACLTGAGSPAFHSTALKTSADVGARCFYRPRHEENEKNASYLSRPSFAPLADRYAAAARESIRWSGVGGGGVTFSTRLDGGWCRVLTGRKRLLVDGTRPTVRG